MEPQQESQLERLEKLKHLRTLSKSANRKSVNAEQAKTKTNPKEEIRAERKREEATKLLEEQRALQNDEDIVRLRGLDWSIEDVEKWEVKHAQKKSKVDHGFTDYQQVAAKKYKNLTDNLKPNLAEYNKRKQDLQAVLDMGLASNKEYRIATSALDNKPNPQSITKMVKDLDKTIEKRLNFSKRKAINPDDDVTFINDRNQKFNQKVSRAYDKYTNDIKAAFERGTALE